MVVKNDYFWKEWDHDALHAEHVNVVTHGFGCGASLVAGIFLCSQAWINNSLPVFCACVVYCLTMLGVYLASMLSHSLFTARWRDRFRVVDQVSIFLFMAGSFTPYAVCLLPLNGWFLLLPATWALALTGSAVKLFITHKKPVPCWYYVVTGWFPALSLIHISSLLPWAGLFWILAGGVSYMIGVHYYVNDHRTIYHHGMWHLWVMLGTACHYISIYCYVVPLAHV
jgi:hemolysin III